MLDDVHLEYHEVHPVPVVLLSLLLVRFRTPKILGFGYQWGLCRLLFVSRATLLHQLVESVLLRRDSLHSQQGVFEQLPEAHSLLRVLFYHLHHHLPHFFADFLLWEAQVAAGVILNGVTKLLFVSAVFEGNPPKEHKIEDDADAPHVALAALARLAFAQHFGSHVEGRAHNLVLRRTAHFGEPEIADDYLPLVQVDVLWLQVPVGNLELPQDSDSLSNLAQIIQGL